MNRVAFATVILLVGLAQAGEDPSWPQVKSRLLAHPRLQGAREGFAEASAFPGRAGAASLPVIEIEVEDFGGSGEASGIARAKTGVWLGGEYRLGDVRGAERVLAAEEVRAAGWDTLQARRELLREGRLLWEDWLAERWRSSLTDSVVGELRVLHTALETARAAGRAEPWEAALARSELADREADARRSRERATALWNDLEALGSGHPEPAAVAPPDAPDSLRAGPGLVEDSLLREIEAARSTAESRLEAARSRPSLSGALGLLADPGSESVGLGVRLAVPLPPWNRVSLDQARSQARSNTARRAAELARAERSRQRQSLAREIVRARQDWLRWNAEVVPARREAVRTVDVARGRGGVLPETAWRVREEYWQARMDALERLGTLRKLQLEAQHLEGVEP